MGSTVKFRRLLLTLLLLPGISDGAVTLSQVETFDSPTTWRIGMLNFGIPSIQPNLGPNGGGDFALLTSSSPGNGPTSRLVIFNTIDWAGDYTSAGVSSLRMDLRNTGSGNLFIRIAVNGPGGWFVTDGQAVNSGLGYASYLFDIRPASLSPGKTMTSPLGDDVQATLSSVTQVRILHSVADASVIGEVANAQLRIDNITAVPEPRVPLLLGLTLVFCNFRRR